MISFSTFSFEYLKSTCPTPIAAVTQGRVLKEKIKKSSVWVVLSCFLSYRSKNEVPVPNTSSTLLVMARGVKGSCPCLLLSISLSPTRTLIRAAKSGADLSHHAMEMWRKKKEEKSPRKRNHPHAFAKTVA